jgi:hypothetical protein
VVRALLEVYGAGPSEELEISMEMDPGTFDAPRLQGFVQGAGGGWGGRKGEIRCGLDTIKMATV